MRIYISGPITGYPDGNKKAFALAEQRLLDMHPGSTVANPHSNGLPAESSWADHMRADIKMLMDCDRVVMLPGWGDSRGARLEYDLAHALGMTVTTLGYSE